MQLIVHVGPHKTGTTSLQNLFSFNRPALANLGIYYEQSRTGREGQHEYPFALKGWDPKLLNEQAPNLPLGVMIAQLLFEAQKFNCDRILLSSESFSQLNIQEWNEFLEVFFLQAPKFQFEIVVVYTDRNVAELAYSLFPTLVHLGLSSQFPDVREQLEAEFRDALDSIFQLEESLDYPITLIQVPYSKSNYLQTWVEIVLGENIVAGLEMVDFQYNTQPPLEITEAKRKANESSTVQLVGQGITEWPKFHTLESIAKQRRQNYEIETKFR